MKQIIYLSAVFLVLWVICITAILSVDFQHEKYDHPTMHDYRMGVQLCAISQMCRSSVTE